MSGWRDTALAIAPSGSLAWAFALWPFGVGTCAAGAVCGAVAGAFGARPLARLADRASAEGGIRRWSATAVVLVALWLALVIAPAVIGGIVRSHSRPAQTRPQALRQTAGASPVSRVHSSCSPRRC
jgi:hypothetical protein